MLTKFLGKENTRKLYQVLYDTCSKCVAKTGGYVTSTRQNDKIKLLNNDKAETKHGNRIECKLINSDEIIIDAKEHVEVKIKIIFTRGSGTGANNTIDDLTRGLIYGVSKLENHILTNLQSQLEKFEKEDLDNEMYIANIENDNDKNHNVTISSSHNFSYPPLIVNIKLEIGKW